MIELQNVIEGCLGSLLALIVVWVLSRVPLLGVLFSYLLERIIPYPAIPEGQKIINNAEVYVVRLARTVAWVYVTVTTNGQKSEHPTVVKYSKGQWRWVFARNWTDNGEIINYLNGN